MSRSDRRLLKKDARDTTPSSRCLAYGPKTWDIANNSSLPSTSRLTSSRSSPSHRSASPGRRRKGRKSKRHDK